MRDSAQAQEESSKALFEIDAGSQKQAQNLDEL